jgi:hypothetical protein
MGTEGRCIRDKDRSHNSIEDHSVSIAEKDRIVMERKKVYISSLLRRKLDTD